MLKGKPIAIFFSSFVCIICPIGAVESIVVQFFAAISMFHTVFSYSTLVGCVPSLINTFANFMRQYLPRVTVLTSRNRASGAATRSGGD